MDIQDSVTVFRTIIESSPFPIFLLMGEELVITLANPAVLRTWGKTTVVLGKKFGDALPQLRNQPFEKLIRNVFRTGIPYFSGDVEAQLEVGGQLRNYFLNCSYQPFKDAEGKISGVICFANDVTTRVVAQKQIEQSENKFRQLVTKSPYIMLVLNGPEFVVEIANQALFDYWRKTPEQTLDKPLLEVLPELKGQSFPNVLKHVYETGEPHGEVETPHLLETADGLITNYVSYLYEPLHNSDGKVSGILVAAEDVTQRVEDRKRTEASEASFRLAVQAAELGTFDKNLVTGLMYWDQRCRELFDIDGDREVTYEGDFLPGLHPDDRERVDSLIKDSAFIKSVSNGDYDVEYRTIGAKDKKLRWVKSKGKVFFDQKEKPIRFIGSVYDITEQKLAEIRKNDFINIASHELKTPLTTVKSYIQVLLAKAKEDDDDFRINALTRVDKQSNKMHSLIRNLLDNARLLEGEFKLDIHPFNIHELLLEVVTDFAVISPSHPIELKDCESVVVNADREKIGQVIENLLSNAVKYSPKGSLIIVRCKTTDGYAQLSVSDEGIGIRRRDQDKLFERFYRVENERIKQVSGFGIGLYLVAEILKYHNSQIAIESEEGAGSTFYFKLPLA
ncbi:PAS domain-containing sensor histidine kinase [Mucilaginibacter gossypii]|uniref:histidine kinase n=1 Tax=Mucilaginibacter gossypii TaxID=551996 RepID=A0A1G7RMC5_9SPHI|nr:PAS domain-containing sensor histidine kinase [Mucilaginibacter gossypii]SDG11928.1 hypothetical protein SAMN05192573_102291 [Mucilaginibacter gossypii]